MKTVLVVAAMLALSASAALADCAWHSAKAKADKTITTASITTTEKQSRLPADTDKVLPDEQKDVTTVTE